jgi:hypothetical protein
MALVHGCFKTQINDHIQHNIHALLPFLKYHSPLLNSAFTFHLFEITLYSPIYSFNFTNLSNVNFNLKSFR